MRNKVPVVLAPRWTKNDLWKKAKAVPSLDLRFADSKSLVDATTGQNLVTFTRASEATFVNSQGQIQTAANNAPRFDHNPTTGESLGLLVEEQRQNLLLQSNQFDTTWTNSNTTELAAQGIAPDGTNTAWELKDTVDGGNTTHSIIQSVSVTSGTTYTWTVWAKAGSLPEIILLWPGTQFGGVTIGARFSLATGTVIAGGGSTVNSITQYPNGWYRIISSNPCTSTGSASLQIRLGSGSGGSYQGDGTGTVLIWGAQLEAGAFPTSYIPTTTAAATRSADVCSLSGSNFSSWYRQDEGTVFVEAIANSDPAANFAVSGAYGLDDGTSNNVIFGGRVLGGFNAFRFDTRTGGVNDCVLSVGSLPVGSKYKGAAALALNNVGVSLNSGAVATDTSVLIPTVNNLKIGYHVFATAGSFNSTIRRLTFWPQRLGNEVLQRITQ